MKKTLSVRASAPAHLLLPLLFGFLLVGLAACGPSAGIFAGGSWQSGGLQHQHIRALEVNPTNAQMLYAGDTQEGVFATADAGLHWTAQNVGLPLPISVSALAFDATEKRLFAATNKGIFVSTDGAQHWSAVGKVGSDLPADTFTTLAFDLSVQNTIYTGTMQHGIYVTTDAGAHWSPTAGSLPAQTPINDLAFDTDHHQLWAATNAGIYLSLDGGKTWQAENNGMPNGLAVYAVRAAAMSGGASGLIYAGTNHGFFRSEDDGHTWKRSQDTLEGTSIRRIFVDFRNPTSLYIATDAGVFQSADQGQTWGGIINGLPKRQPVYALQVGADGYSQLFVAVNDVYFYPGTSSGISITNILPLVLIAVLFYLLYRVTRRNRTGRRSVLKPEQVIDSTVPLTVDDEQTTQSSNGKHPPQSRTFHQDM